MRETLLNLGWVTVPHPCYFTDLAPTDYHSFRYLSNYLREKKFDDEGDLTTDRDDCFRHKSLNFDEHGILALPVRWRQVIDSN
jgi:[histone H3]-lysine36 N-dimethyltransferase SETMAR